MTQGRSWFVLVLALGGVLAACGSSGGAPASGEPAAPAAPAAPTPAPAAPAPAPAAAAAPTDKVEDPTFVLAATPVGAYSAGKLGAAPCTRLRAVNDASAYPSS